MMLTYALTLGIVGSWIFRMIAQKRLIFQRTILDIPLGLFVLSQILATIFSIHPYTSIFGYYTRFHGGLLSTFTYVILFYAFVSNVSKRQLPAFFVTMLAASIGVSLYAIPEHFGHSPSCLLINSGQSFDVSCWIQDVQNRIFGTFGQPNWLAAYAITMMLWAAGILGWSRQRQFFKVVSAAAIVLLFITLTYTRSRSGIIGLGVGSLVFAGGAGWLLYNQLRDKSATLTRQLLFWLIGIAAVCGVFFVTSGDELVTSLARNVGIEATVINPPVTEEGDLATAPVVNRLEVGITDSGDIRKIVWQGAIDIWRRYPVFGSGVETFAYSYYQDRPLEHNLVSEWDFLYNKAHNEFLNFLATTGIVGLVAYSTLLLAFMGLCGWYLFQSKTPAAERWILLGTLTAIIALSISNFFGFSTVMVSILLFILPAIVIVLLADTYPHLSQSIQAAPATATTHKLETSQWLIIGTFALIIFYGWFMIYSWWQADYNYAMGKQYFQAGYYSEGMGMIQQAILQSPEEALYYDELSSMYAQLAAGLSVQGESTSAAQLAQAAILTSERTLQLNDRHLNFHKSRARVFISLATIDESYLEEAKIALETALSLSPTDAKLMYNLALVEKTLGQTEQAQARLVEVVKIKSNYEAARTELARMYREAGEYQAAEEQYLYILNHIAPNNEVVQQELTDLEAFAATQSAQPR